MYVHIQIFRFLRYSKIFKKLLYELKINISRKMKVPTPLHRYHGDFLKNKSSIAHTYNIHSLMREDMFVAPQKNG